MAPEQRLTNINIAEAHNQLLVQKRCFDRRTATLHDRMKIRASHIRGQGLDSQAAQKAMCVFLVCGNHIHHAEPAWVNEASACSVFRLQDKVLMFWWSRIHA